MKKVNNLHKILQYIIYEKSVSRADLSRKFGLNKATVSYIIQELESSKLIKQCDELKETKGRHSVLYKLNENFGTIISINLKPQNVKSYVLDLNGKILFEENKKITIDSKETLVETTSTIISSFLEQYPNNLGVCIGVHGTVYLNEKIHFTPFNNISEFDLKSKLVGRFVGTNIFIENEANISALGETQFLNEANVVTIINGKGIGAGVITNYKIYKGHQGFAGEIGHTVVVPNGEKCTCGGKGCLELYSSEENIYLKASKIKGYDVDYKKFIELYNENDKDIVSIYLESLDYLSIAINNIQSMLNPSHIILNGMLYCSIPKTLEYIQSLLKDRVQNNSAVRLSSLNDTAFCIGSARHIVNKNFVETLIIN